MHEHLSHFTVGDFRCAAIRDGNEWDLNVVLIDTGEHRVLIDTGVGSAASPPGLLAERLRASGTPPSEIDVVILSHADFDHIGGAIDSAGQRAFPNARYTIHRGEWEFWSSGPDRLPASDAYDEAFRQIGHDVPAQRLAQLHGSIELVEPETEIVPGIRIISAPGHTPGNTIVAVESGSERFYFVGDLLYEPSNIEDPGWYSVFDYDPREVVQTRRRVLDRVATEKALLMASHLPFPGLGRVTAQHVGWRWHPYTPQA